MDIIWVNHASFILSHAGVRLLCDPWVWGTAFDNGWALLAESKITPEDFRDVTHIWFSHEHPDHFSPPNLKRIPPEYKRNITVLFQETVDRKVANYCRGAGFKEVVELRTDEYYRLADDFEILCNPHTDGDSYLYVRTRQWCVLNLNDCVVKKQRTARQIRRRTGRVDVLLTQFSYANKVGNVGDDALRRASAMEKVGWIVNQAAALRPRWVIPFASFVWFCHEENYYMNGGNVTIDEVHEHLTRTLAARTLVMYPGDVWRVGEPFDSAPALARYRDDYAAVRDHPPLQRTAPVDTERLVQAARTFVDRLVARNDPLVLRTLEPASIYLEDYGRAYELSLESGLVERQRDPEECDIRLTSEPLHFCFAHEFGGDTLNINARFQTTPRGDYRRLRRYFTISSLNNRGISARARLRQRLAERVRGGVRALTGRAAR
jgi:UDP-MurNAc hydroxylase